MSAAAARITSTSSAGRSSRGRASSRWLSELEALPDMWSPACGLAGDALGGPVGSAYLARDVDHGVGDQLRSVEVTEVVRRHPDHVRAPARLRLQLRARHLTVVQAEYVGRRDLLVREVLRRLEEGHQRLLRHPLEPVVDQLLVLEAPQLVALERG